MKIYGVQVYSEQDATHFWESISKSSGGKHLAVGSCEPLVTVMLMAAVYSEYDTDILEVLLHENKHCDN